MHTRSNIATAALPDVGRLTPAARRILEVAAELFYERGITAVGVDRIAAESGVTKRTLYNRFGAKDQLVAAYLMARAGRWRSRIEAALAALPETSAGSPWDRVLIPFDVLPSWLAEGSRGCGFVNALAELPDPDHPGHRVATEQKAWLRDLFARLAEDAGVQSPAELADQLLYLHEGAIIASSALGDQHAPSTARAAAASLLMTVGSPLPVDLDSGTRKPESEA